MTGKFKCAVAGAALAAALTASNAATAAVVLDDNFDSYTAGGLSGQGGWTATAAAATPMQVAGASDKFVQLGTAGQDEYKAFSASVPHTDGQGIHTSLAVNVSAVGSATGDYFSHLSSPAGTTSFFYQRLFARSSGAGYQLGLLDTSGGTPVTTWGSTVLNFAQDYDVDVTWNFVAGATNDTFAVTVDGGAYLTHTWTSSSAEPTSLDAANLRQGGAANSATVQVDDYFVESVVPEPATLGLLVVGGLALLARRRRRI